MLNWWFIPLRPAAGKRLFSRFWTDFQEIDLARGGVKTADAPWWLFDTASGLGGIGFAISLSNTGCMDDKLKRKIFLVDDDPFSLTMYAAYLDGQGYENVAGFASGGAVLEKLKEGPDIVLLDHRPGDMPGLDVLDRIKRYNPNIYVVFMGSQDEQKLAQAAVQAGAFDYVFKEGAVLPRIAEVMNRIFTVQEYLNKKNSQSSRFFFL